MPWDGTELWVADVKADGSLGAREKVAGGADESIFQPEWSPDGALYFVSDRTGWWNLYRRSRPGRAIEALSPDAAPSSASRSGRSAHDDATRSSTRDAHRRHLHARAGAGSWRSSKPIRASSSRSICGSSRSTSFAPTHARVYLHRRLADRRAPVGRADVAGRGRSRRCCAAVDQPIAIDPAWISVPKPSRSTSDGQPTCTPSTTRRRIRTSRRPPASGRRCWC